MRQEAFFTASSQFYRWPHLHIASSLLLILNHWELPEALGVEHATKSHVFRQGPSIA